MKLHVTRRIDPEGHGFTSGMGYLTDTGDLEVTDEERTLIAKYGLETRRVGDITLLGQLLVGGVTIVANDALTREERIVKLLEGLNEIQDFISKGIPIAGEQDFSIPWTPT